jgi:hypothetical protein
MSSVIVRTAIAPMFAQPGLRFEQVSQLVLGETGRVVTAEGEWRRVAGDHDQYEGWVHSGYLVETDAVASDRWRREAAGWSAGATLRLAGQRLRLPLRARISLDGGKVGLPDGRRAEVVEGDVIPMADTIAAARAKPAEQWALEYFEGAPYEWGGVTPWGVDCSGLVQTTFAARGQVLPRDAALQVAIGSEVALDSTRPGDLLFFRGETTDRITHVAFAAADDTLIHSTVACGSMLVEPWRAGSRAAPLRQRLVAARRLEER